MTSIEKLQLCGVRSFDPNPASQQCIQFQKPLTVILGKNGAGKTTIIEALLNACTGAMPPGSGTDKVSFVYDPKVVGETEVKAQIRLIFTGKGGKLMQVIRSFQVTRNPNRATFATLDNTVAFQDSKTGEVISSTYRASDVDRVVPEMLGVSSAVLEHVIFCHQEECNWPLGSPKDVKRIFDDIFAATRYVLALDRLRDNSKEFRRQLKEHEASLMALREHREQAKQLEQQVAQKESVIKAIQSRSTDIEPELRDLRQAREELRAIEEEMEALEREVAVENGRLEERREAIQRMGVPPTNATLGELLEKRNNFTSKMQQVKETLVADTRRYEVAAARKRAAEEELYRYRSNVEILERDAHMHRQNIIQLRELVQNLPLDCALVDESMDDEGALRLILQRSEIFVEAARKRFSDAIESIRQKICEEEGKMQVHSRTLDRANQEIEMRERAMEMLQRRVGENGAAILALGGDDCRTQHLQIQREVEVLRERAAAVEELRKRGIVEERSSRILMELEAQNKSVAKLREEMMKQKSIERNQQDLILLRQQIDEMRVSVATAVQKDLLPLLANAGVGMPPELTDDFSSLQPLTLLRSQITQIQNRKTMELRTLQTRLQDFEKMYAIQEQKISYYSDELNECRRVLAAGTKQCAGVVEDVSTYEEALLNAKDAVDRAVEKRHALEALATCYHDFSMVAEEKTMCAVCERCFESPESLQMFLKKNMEKQHTLPAALEAVQAAVNTAQTAYRNVEKMQSVVAMVRQSTNRISVLEADIKALEDKISPNCAERSEVAAQRDEVEQALSNMSIISQHVSMVCSMAEKVATLRNTLERKEVEAQTTHEAVGQDTRQRRDDCSDAMQHTDSPHRSFDEISEAYAIATEKLHHLNRQFTEAQRVERGQDESAVDRTLQERKTDLFKAEVAVRKLEELQLAAREQQEDLAQERTRVAELKSQALQTQKTVEVCKQRVQELRKELQEVEVAGRGAVDAAEQQSRQLQLALAPVLNYVHSDCAKRLEELQGHLREADSAYKAAVQEEGQLASLIKEAQKTLGEQHQCSADLGRHIELLQQTASIVANETELAEKERRLASLKSSRLHGVEQVLGEEAQHASLSTLREIMTSKLTSLEKIRAQQDGNMEAMLFDVNQLKQQLRGDKYQNIEKRYRSTFLKAQTTEISIQDIEKYYSALEKAVQSYHQEKIAQINQIIAELWRQTYRGSDIDTVEIRSETEGTTTTAARRSYNYRVVMKRGNNEMDMRGRCSAGQKVLASIIIRLALSEAFCCDCGILALDEPTTNLDDDNARSLADALRTLIQVRRTVKHFQLIVITHDEQFVRALGGQSLEKFYYVHKDREGSYSVIDERTFEQLFA